MKLDNRGFGFFELFLFAALVIYIIFSAYSFFYSLVSEVFDRGPHYSGVNYVNPYTKYYKNGTISRVDNPVKTTSNRSVSESSYTKLERELEKVTENYVNDYYRNLDDSGSLYVKSSTLKNYGYLDEIVYTGDNKECSGYTKVSYDNGKKSYTAYINCGSYYTDGFESRFE